MSDESVVRSATAVTRYRGWPLFALIALVGAFLITRWTAEQPSYTDAFYYFNAGERLAHGQGLTDAYLWNYVVLPPELPAPSHLFWMPMPSLMVALGLTLFGDSYAAAQIPFALMYAGVVLVGFWLGGHIGRTSRHAWVAGLLTLFSGYFTRFWGATSTFAPYGVFGALCLLCLGMGLTKSGRSMLRPYVWFAFGGVFAALGHLSRADGLLLLAVGWAAILWEIKNLAQGRREAEKQREEKSVSQRYKGTEVQGEDLKDFFLANPAFWRFKSVIVLTAAYLLVMSVWFVRNLNAVGTPLPVSGASAVWLTEYNDLFNYPPNVSMGRFFENGIGLLISSRWSAFTTNLATFVGVEGLIVMTPLMLIGLWRRRREAFLRPFWLYALGLHLAMTLAFPFPGSRGGLFHSAAALVPFWAALGVVGLDDVVDWIARRRRRWKANTAKLVFSVALLGLAAALSWMVSGAGRTFAATPRLYRELVQRLPADGRVMINDPSQMYYFTKLGGVSLPNAAPDVIREIAARYDIDYLLLEFEMRNGQRVAPGIPNGLLPILDNPPDFLSPVPLDTPNARLYAIES
ncbi:MAG: hypothetical protein H7175_00915 [Burkholderiales bacterium]|nr:hypothetical protein [Anaerolineae bacterium]